ncbi:MAG TPA: NADH-ubiquinone oxidoreductase-F iron-sulfur binding region domain-containing protein, partial [Gaiellaceae bacterium]|nr:NADH-ubiquinone oxidoreductase-F iron-sulfur binding region domain-containing protein [Gaiellaceae bacterium]
MDVLRATALISGLPTERTRLLDNLGRLRREVGPITPELSDTLADHMNIRRGEVHEVVSFYSFLQVPTDVARVCTGPVCDCFGARDLLARTPSAIEVACLGHCDLAPAMTRGDEIVPDVTHSTNDGPAIGLGTRDRTLADYETRGGLALLRDLPPLERIVGELKASGLSGFGGAGFPTGVKWEAVWREPGPRYVVVNADEGEPGTIKDRYVMELRPHLMIEATLIAMRALDATEGYIYLREEYATARYMLLQAIEEFRAARLSEGLALELVIGAGAYIAGEETAMLESMEGRRAMPRLKPPFPSQVGYLGRPTLIQNVETLAHIPAILRSGGAWWAGLGLREASGTRLWSVSGAVRRPGCYEAPNGITTRELVEEHAGGFSESIGCVVPGGAASGILPPGAFDAPLTRDGLREWNAGPGSAAVQAFPASYSPLRLLAETMRFFAEESCQKCTPCRIGNRALHHLAEELVHDRAPMTREKVDEWLLAMEKTSICGLGQASPFPVRGAMQHWPELFAPLEQGVA